VTPSPASGTGWSSSIRPEETAARAASEVISLVTDATSNWSPPVTSPRNAVSTSVGETTATPARPTGQSSSRFIGLIGTRPP
jgi:hypothetical protein